MKPLSKASLWYKVRIVGGTLAIMIGKPVVAAGQEATRNLAAYGLCRLPEPKSNPYWLSLPFVPLQVAMPFVPSRMILPLTGLLFAAISTLADRAVQLPRAYVFGCLICALALALGLAGAPVDTGMGLLFGVAGAITMFSGGWTLWHYLEHA